MKRLAASVILLLYSVSFFGCSAPQNQIATPQKQKELVVYTPHSLELYTPLINEFEQRYNIQVEVVNAGTLEFLKRLEEEKDSPKGDMLWGGTVSSVYAGRELFEDYVTPNDVYFPTQYRNTEGNITHFSEVLSVLMVNTDLMGDIEITGYESLLDPRLRGKIAMSNPSKTSSGREHLINMLYAMGEGDPQSGWDFVSRLSENMNGGILDTSYEVYTGVANGKFVVGLTYEEGAANYVQEGAPIQVVYMEEGVIVKPDGIYIIKNARNMRNAQKFVDFLTSKEVQQMLAEEFKHRPLHKEAGQPVVFPDKQQIKIIEEDPAQVKEKIGDWTSRFLSHFREK